METALQAPTTREPSAEETAIFRALEECLVIQKEPGPAAAFRLSRTLQDILAHVRERIASEYESVLRRETARYKQACEDSSWFEERAGQIKALVEAGALRERERILQIVFDAAKGPRSLASL